MVTFLLEQCGYKFQFSLSISELAREKRFLTATVYKDEQQKRAGTLSLEQFKHHAKTEQELQDLRDRGLTDQEIELSLLNCDENMSNKKASQNSVELGKSEVATQRAKESLTERLKLRGDALQKETSYSNAREMTRREMEIELSLHRSTDKADKLKHLVKPKITDFSQDDPVMQTLKEYEEREKWMKRTRKSQAKPVETPKRMRCAQGYVNEEDEREEDECEEDDIDVLVGPVLAPLHVRVKPLDEAHVKRNKLSIDEIKSIPKFKNYDPGVPSKVLYIKNLPRNAYKEDLAKLFVRFECLDEPTKRQLKAHWSSQMASFSRTDPSLLLLAEGQSGSSDYNSWLNKSTADRTSKSRNLTIDVVHRQVLEDHLLFFAFKNPPAQSSGSRPLNATYRRQYKCLNAPSPFCPQNWVDLTACSATKQISSVFFSCNLRAHEVLIFNEYMVRGLALTHYGVKNATTTFKVKIPVYPKLDNLTATAVEYNSVKLSWNKVALLSDLKKYDPKNIHMRMNISKIRNNTIEFLERVMKPWATSTVLHGFEAEQNYSFIALYQFAIPGFTLPWSTVSGPVVAKTFPKPVISQPPFNQSCLQISNYTGIYFNISWMAFPSTHPLQRPTTINIELKTNSAITLIKVNQWPSTMRQCLVFATKRSLLASIAVCNQAGCSDKVYTACRMLTNEGPVAEPGNSFLPYAAAISILVVICIVGAFLFYWKKRRKVEQERNTELPYIEPKAHVQYDQPASTYGPYEPPPVCDSTDVDIGGNRAAEDERIETREVFNGSMFNTSGLRSNVSLPDA
eukprot:gene17045-18761_t